MNDASDFWSRRRAAVAAEVEEEKAALADQALAEEQAALEEKSDEEILAELGLPDPDTMKQGDDFSGFMSNMVPDRLRRRALRKLWRTNPVLANVDMLVDYGEDFTDSALVIENLQTTYQVGKGMLKHVQEMARQAEEKAREADEETPAAEPDEIVEDEDVLLAAVETPEAATEEIIEDDEEVFATPAPRRMKFRIEESA